MSILAAAGLADSRAASAATWVFFLVISAAAATATGLFHARAVSGPPRLPMAAGMPLRLLMAATIGCFVWLLAQQFYFTARRPAGPSTKPVAITKADFSSADWVYLSTVPPIVALGAVLGADVILFGGAAQMERLGLRRNPIPGAGRGLLGILIASPMIWFVSSVTEWAYETLHYAHPQEHELLKVMGDTTSHGARFALITGAVVLAPLFEETIFRAHLQTFFRELLCSLSNRMTSKTSGSVLPGLPFAEKMYPRKSAAWQSWTAIFIASAMFTSVHPRWMWPPIFFLAICLGYAYERTGSLWTSIVMHSLFNASSTYLFLSQSH